MAQQSNTVDDKQAKKLGIHCVWGLSPLILGGEGSSVKLREVSTMVRPGSTTFGVGSAIWFDRMTKVVLGSKVEDGFDQI